MARGIQPAHRPVRRVRRAGERGFTLIELLVAVIAGLFVVVAAFMLSKASVKVMADETRVGNAQMNLRLGLDRLRADIMRAGYMTTPNVRRDPDVCPDPNTQGFPARLQSVYYMNGGSHAGTPLSDSNGLNPDAIVVTGNFVGADSYLVSSVESSTSGGYDVWLQRNFGAMQRLLNSGEAGTVQNVLDDTFPSGKMLRIQNPLGSSQFMTIDSATMGTTSGGLAPKVHLTLLPNLTIVQEGNPNKRCGISGYGLGASVNTVSFVRYDLRNLAAAAPWAYPDGDTTKYDLVRTELNHDGTEITTSPKPQSIVAEYIVDMKFSFTIDEGTLTTGTYREPRLVEYRIDDPTAIVETGDVLVSGSTAKPERIRSVRIQLTARSKDPDRSVALTPATGPGLLRYFIAANQYARARTDAAEVSLINQKGEDW